MKIIAISGSLRKNSFNTGLIRSAIELKQDSIDIEYFDIKDIPLYNADIDGQYKPKAVLELAKKVAEADGLLISVPEYNYSFTAALKNAFDWLSRMMPMPLLGKPLAMMGASYGMSGSMRAQLHFRQVVIFMDMRVMNKPEVMVAAANEKFDTEGNLTDEQTKQHIKKMLISFEKFIADNKH
jgi:chromate reductase